MCAYVRYEKKRGEKLSACTLIEKYFGVRRARSNINILFCRWSFGFRFPRDENRYHLHYTLGRHAIITQRKVNDETRFFLTVLQSLGKINYATVMKYSTLCMRGIHYVLSFLDDTRSFRIPVRYSHKYVLENELD